jgi:hypothetical protein
MQQDFKHQILPNKIFISKIYYLLATLLDYYMTQHMVSGGLKKMAEYSKRRKQRHREKHKKKNEEKLSVTKTLGNRNRFPIFDWCVNL